MPAYTSVESVAEKLNVTLDQLGIMQAFGWISITQKNGAEFVRADHEDKAKLILYLQDVLRPTPEQISTVLVAQEPNYFIQDVPRILARAHPKRQTPN